jgi:dynein heavy chain
MINGFVPQWLYLEPIFASDDIKKQMPEEARRFASVDGVFKNTVAKCMADPKVLTFTRSEGLLENLKSSFDLLELINKGLNAYLEQKRYIAETLQMFLSPFSFCFV